MDVKKATHIARDYITAVFADTEIAQLGPEEAVSDPDTGQWRITCGFRPPLVPAGVLIADEAESAARLQGSRYCLRRQTGYLAHRPADAGASAMMMTPEGFFRDASRPVRSRRYTPQTNGVPHNGRAELPRPRPL